MKNHFSKQPRKIKFYGLQSSGCCLCARMLLFFFSARVLSLSLFNALLVIIPYSPPFALIFVCSNAYRMRCCFPIPISYWFGVSVPFFFSLSLLLYFFILPLLPSWAFCSHFVYPPRDWIGARTSEINSNIHAHLHTCMHGNLDRMHDNHDRLHSNGDAICWWYRASATNIPIESTSSSSGNDDDTDTPAVDTIEMVLILQFLHGKNKKMHSNNKFWSGVYARTHEQSVHIDVRRHTQASHIVYAI